MPHRTRGLLFASATALLWGVLAIVLKYSLRIANVETIVCFRFLFAFVMLGAILAARRPAQLRLLKRPPPLALVAAALLAGNYLAFFKGIELTGASTAQVLIQTSPLLFAAIGVFYFREKLRPLQRVGFLVAGAGFVFFHRDRIAQFSTATYDAGLLSIAVAALTWALWATLQKVLILRGHKPQALNLLTYGVAGLILLPFADLGALRDVGALHWLVLGFLGANTLLAYGALGEALRDAPANQVSMIITLNPMITLASMALLAALEVTWIEAEPIRLLGYVGALLMVSGVLLVVGATRARARPASPSGSR